MMIAVMKTKVRVTKTGIWEDRGIKHWKTRRTTCIFQKFSQRASWGGHLKQAAFFFFQLFS